MPNELLDVVKACENQLGWFPAGDNIYRARAGAAVRLERAMAKDPTVSTEDLWLALAYCRTRRQPIQTPAHLLRFVKDARALAVVEDRPTELDQAVREAIAWEMATEDEHTEHWVGRLIRSYGGGRAEVLTEWREAGRGGGHA